MDIRDKLKVFLEKVGADYSHSKRQLIDHLLGTYDKLKEKGAPETLCVAGALHSIYSTNAFQQATLTFDQRDLVRDEFGVEAENLAYIFCSIERPFCLQTGKIVNRFTNEEINLDDNVVYQLRILEAANLLEQNGSIMLYPRIVSAWSNNLRPMTFVSEIINL